MTQLLDHTNLKYSIIGLGVVATAYFVVSTILSYRKLRHFPGPPLAIFSQLWLFNVTAKGDLYLAAEEVVRKYGSPCRIGPNLLIQDDPEIYKFVNAPRSPFRRGHWYAGMKFDPRINNLLSEQDEKRHTELRAKMMPGYTGKEVPSLEPKIDARIHDLLKLITTYATTSTPFDLSEKCQFFTLDSLTDIAFGYPFGYLTSDSDLYNYNKSSTEFFPVMELGTNIPFIHSILSSSLMQSLAGPKPEDKAGLGAIIGVAQKVVQQRFHPDSSNTKPSVSRDRDMLDAFMRHGLTQLECESESLLQILAGSDSTATTIRMTFLYLLTNPPFYTKLLTEIDTATKSSLLSTPIATYTECTTHLPYLTACIREALRLHPPLNGIVTKMSPPTPLDIPIYPLSANKTVHIPASTQLCLSQYSMMRRTDIFGPAALLFMPDRWLPSHPQNTRDPENLKNMERIWDHTFATGRFTCLGKGVALMEIHKVVVEVLRRFELGCVDPIRTVRESRCHQLFVQRGMMVVAREREGGGVAGKSE